MMLFGTIRTKSSFCPSPKDYPTQHYPENESKRQKTSRVTTRATSLFQ
jgi:hypothetical protein